MKLHFLPFASAVGEQRPRLNPRGAGCWLSCGTSRGSVVLAGAKPWAECIDAIFHYLCLQRPAVSVQYARALSEPGYWAQGVRRLSQSHLLMGVDWVLKSEPLE